MKEVWSMSVADYLEICELAKANGKKPGESIEEEMRIIMAKKNTKPISHTELTKEEWVKEQGSKGRSVLDMTVDDEGKTKFKINKPMDDNG